MTYSFEGNRIPGGIAADDDYWKALERGSFKLPRCVGCGVWTWPAHYRCGACGSWDFDWTEIEPVGTVFSWIRTWYAFEGVKGYAGDIPYVTVLAEVSGAGGARVMGVLKGGEDGLRVGAPVWGTIDPPSEKTKAYAAIRWSLAPLAVFARSVS